MLLSHASNMKIFRYVAGKLLENPLMAAPMHSFVGLAMAYMGDLQIQRKV